MGTGALSKIVVGIAVYIAAQALISNSITGTGTGDVLIQTLVLIMIAIAIVIGIVKFT